MISVITPTLNERDNLAARAGDLGFQTRPFEWIVVDGGSEDGTPELARRLGATVLSAEGGRGPQLNAGARVARGHTYLFLHADSELPPDALRRIRRQLRDPEVVGGNFEFAFDGDDWLGHALTGYYWLQRHVAGLYFGDSGIFVRREVFEQLGGFPDTEILEDWDFCRRLEAAGETVCLASTMRTSGRRYRKKPVRALATWGAIIALYSAGVPARVLAPLYGRD